MKEFITLAKTDKEGNLRVYKDALNDFCRQNKDCSFVLKLFAIPCERTPPHCLLVTRWCSSMDMSIQKAAALNTKRR